MKTETLIGIGAGIVVIGGVAWLLHQTGGDDPITGGISTVVDTFVRGKRLTNTSLDSSGNIPDSPQSLADQAVDAYGSNFAEALNIQTLASDALDVYALARMSRSEADASNGVDNRLVRLHVALNDYASVSWAGKLSELFTYSTHSGAKGLFGDQNGRRYSTARDPYAGDIDLAIKAIVDHANGIDPSEGAVKFVDVNALGGVQPGTPSWEKLVAKWGQDGLTPVHLDGQPADFYVFVRNA